MVRNSDIVKAFINLSDGIFKRKLGHSGLLFGVETLLLIMIKIKTCCIRCRLISYLRVDLQLELGL